MFSLLLSLFVYQMQLLYLSTSLYVCQQLFYLFFCCFLFISFLCESLFIISYPVWLVKNFFNFFFIPDGLSCRHQPQQLLSLPSAICFVNTFFHFSPKNFNSRESSVFFKNTPAFLLRGARHASAWPISSAHPCICTPFRSAQNHYSPDNMRPAGGCIRRGIGSHHWYWLASRYL